MKKTKSFYISLVFSLLILVVPVIYFLYHKLNGHVIDIRNFVTEVSFYAFLLSMLFVLIKKIPDKVKVVFTLIILLATSVFCTYVGLLGGYVDFEALKGIEEIAEYNAELPADEDRYYFETEIETDSYGAFEDIACYRYLSTGVFQQRSFITIVKYSQEHFENEVKSINTSKSFYDEAVLDGDPIPVFTYDGFDFRLEKNEDYYYPKQTDFIGINKETNEIAYVYFEDMDLDGVWSFENLMEVYAGWHLIEEERANEK